MASRKLAAGKADLLIEGGSMVLAQGIRQGGAIVVRGRHIAAILGPRDKRPAAREVLNARGKIVFPGVVDAHVHVDTPGPPTKPFGVYSDDFDNMSRAAILGGVTTVIPFVFASGTDDRANYLRSFRDAAKRDAWADFGFHFGVRDDKDVRAIPDVLKMGVRSFKSLMAYKQQGAMANDKLLAAAMKEIGRSGGLMMVHAEDGELIDALETRAKAAGERTPPVYACCRPSEAENIAIIRALALARGTGCVLYIVHLSTREGLISAKLARGMGQDVIIETCPHYLLLTHKELEPHRLGPFAKIGPPLREHSNGKALWSGLRAGDIDIVGSDHAPRLREQKLAGKDDIFAAPFGSPGLETMLPVLFDEFRKKRLPLATLARLLCEAPARTFGLYPKKGAIAVGADADLVLIDPAKRWTVDPAKLQTHAKYSLWAGRKVKGKAVATVLRGRIMQLEGKTNGGRGWGEFLPHHTRGH